MPILEDDIKLLKAAVQNDTSGGGGAMTGVAVVDGQDNNLFPDTSESDRAYGRVQLRKVFGVAHTADTDTLLGAHAFVVEAPADPLVHATLFKGVGWADTRAAAQQAIEAYAVKGPRLTPAIRDVHYAGSRQLQLYVVGSAAFPVGGDCIVVKNPAALGYPEGREQFVRVLSVVLKYEEVGDGNGSFRVTVATLALAQPLAFDVLGGPLQRVVQQGTDVARVYATASGGGTAFYGVKALQSAGAVGDVSVAVAGGIFTPLVPSSTIETALVDQYPLLGSSGLGPSGSGAVELPGYRRDPVAMRWGPGSTLTCPTAIAPGSLRLQCYAGVFTDRDGELLQGAATVGSVNYAAGTVVLHADAPVYSTGPTDMTLRYVPAAAGSAAAHTDHMVVTQANQGLVWTRILGPVPARFSVRVSYMAQGRWYVLTDSGSGKLSGASSAYGVGSVNYASGALQLTCGALPDVGSPILLQWCDAANFKAFLPAQSTSMEGRAGADIVLAADTVLPSLVLTWQDELGRTVQATASAAGVLTAQTLNTYEPSFGAGQVRNGVLRFAPPAVPKSDVALAYAVYSAGKSAYTANATAQTITLTDAPVQPGSVVLWVALVCTVADTVLNAADACVAVLDVGGTGVLRLGATGAVCGALDYASGVATIDTAVTFPAEATRTVRTSHSSWLGLVTWSVTGFESVVTQAHLSVALNGCSYSGAAAPGTQPRAATVLRQALQWSARIGLPAAQGGQAYEVALLDSGLCFEMEAEPYRAGVLYSAKGGVLRRGWNFATAQALDAQAGTVTSDGVVRFAALAAGTLTAITWRNVPVSACVPWMTSAVFRTATAPLKVGVFNLELGDGTAVNASGGGVLSGPQVAGSVDFERGWVSLVHSGAGFAPGAVRYGAVALSYLPLDEALLGLSTARLPLDGKVPVFRAGDLVVVHNTAQAQLPNPAVKGNAYGLGRTRLASVRLRDALGALVPGALYTTDLDAGTLTLRADASLAGFTQPFAVEHRVQDLSVCLGADISGKITLNRGLTHSFAAGSSFVSSALPAGDLFAFASTVFDQSAWTGVWADAPLGDTTLAQFNATDYPLQLTNRGTITGRWALVFTSTTAFRVVGQDVGQVGFGDVNSVCAPVNPATQAAYFSIDPLAWGGGWSVGNVLRFNTVACGVPLWLARTVLQGPATLASDRFALAWRGDVNA